MRTSWLNRLTGMLCSLAVIATVTVSVGSLAGCNTVKGFGRDVESMAQGGQDLIDGKQ